MACTRNTGKHGENQTVKKKVKHCLKNVILNFNRETTCSTVKDFFPANPWIFTLFFACSLNLVPNQSVTCIEAIWQKTKIVGRFKA